MGNELGELGIMSFNILKELDMASLLNNETFLGHFHTLCIVLLARVFTLGCSTKNGEVYEINVSHALDFFVSVLLFCS